MNTLNDRRSIAKICFIFQLIKGQILSPKLLNLIDFRVRQVNTRNVEILNINFNDNDPYNVMREKFNEFSNVIDLSLGTDTLKNHLKEHFKSILN